MWPAVSVFKEEHYGLHVYTYISSQQLDIFSIDVVSYQKSKKNYTQMEQSYQGFILHLLYEAFHRI